MSLPNKRDPFLNPSALVSKVRYSVIAGGAAGNLTLAEISLDNDRILQVWHLPPPTVSTAGWKGGNYTFVAGDDTAGFYDLVTGLGSVTSLQLFIKTAANVHVPLADAVVTITGGTVRIADGGATFAVTAGDTVYWWATNTTQQAATAVQVAPVDLTSEFSVTAANTINNSGGTATTSGWVLVAWYDSDYGEKANAAFNA